MHLPMTEISSKISSRARCHSEFPKGKPRGPFGIHTHVNFRIHHRSFSLLYHRDQTRLCLLPKWSALQCKNVGQQSREVHLLCPWNTVHRLFSHFLRDEHSNFLFSTFPGHRTGYPCIATFHQVECVQQVLYMCTYMIDKIS